MEMETSWENYLEIHLFSNPTGDSLIVPLFMAAYKVLSRMLDVQTGIHPTSPLWLSLLSLGLGVCLYFHNAMKSTSH